MQILSGKESTCSGSIRQVFVFYTPNAVNDISICGVGDPRVLVIKKYSYVSIGCENSASLDQNKHSSDFN
jgi:hypothetical protein